MGCRFRLGVASRRRACRFSGRFDLHLKRYHAEIGHQFDDGAHLGTCPHCVFSVAITLARSVLIAGWYGRLRAAIVGMRDRLVWDGTKAQADSRPY